MRLRLAEDGDELCRQIAVAEASHAKSLSDEADDMSEIAGTSHVLSSLENIWLTICGMAIISPAG